MKKKSKPNPWHVVGESAVPENTVVEVVEADGDHRELKQIKGVWYYPNGDPWQFPAPVAWRNRQ